MRVAYAKGQQGGHVGLGCLSTYALYGEWTLVIRLQCEWERVPHGSFAVSRHAVYCSIEKSVGLFAKGVPIGRVKCFLRRKIRVAGRCHGVSFGYALAVCAVAAVAATRTIWPIKRQSSGVSERGVRRSSNWRNTLCDFGMGSCLGR